MIRSRELTLPSLSLLSSSSHPSIIQARVKRRIVTIDSDEDEEDVFTSKKTLSKKAARTFLLHSLPPFLKRVELTSSSSSFDQLPRSKLDMTRKTSTTMQMTTISLVRFFFFCLSCRLSLELELTLLSPSLRPSASAAAEYDEPMDESDASEKPVKKAAPKLKKPVRPSFSSFL